MIPLDFRPLWLELLGPHTGKGITMSELRKRMIRDDSKQIVLRIISK